MAQPALWLAPRAGTDGDLFGAKLRFILENDNPNDANRRYIDWSFKKCSVGWEDFEAAFKSWWTKSDPINGMPYFSLEWTANRTGLTKEQIADLDALYRRRVQSLQSVDEMIAQLIQTLEETGELENTYIILPPTTARTGAEARRSRPAACPPLPSLETARDS